MKYGRYSDSPTSFFENYHRTHSNERDLINPDWTWFQTKYHYNLVENGIIDLLMLNQHKILGSTVLDLGSGIGHWVDFYSKYMEAKEIIGIDFAPTAVARLQSRFPELEIFQHDIVEPMPTFYNKFDIVNAVGVMFHITDDEKWEQTVSNLCKYVKRAGVVIIGGEFGDNTRQVSHHRRVRSLEYWQDVLNRHSCEVVGVKIFDWMFGASAGGILDNLMAFVKNKGAADGN